MTLLALGGSLLVVGATAATPSKGSVVIRPLPAVIFKGQRLTVSAYVSGYSGPCVLTVRYKSGRVDHRRAVSSVIVAWTFRVPAVPSGPATMHATCGSATSATVKTLVQPPLQTPKIEIVRRGFTQRSLAPEPESRVSYGLAVRNDRPTTDAVNVDVLSNFISADDRVLGSAHLLIPRLPAGATFYGGGEAFLSETTAAVRIETVVHATSAQPVGPGKLLISDLVVDPLPFPANPLSTVQSVHGQILNTYKVPMQSAFVGAVVLDAAGNIIGGGTAYAPGPLTLGAREGFSVGSTFSEVVFSAVASSLATSIPVYPTTP